MATLIGFGPDPAQSHAPRPAPARGRTLRLAACAVALLLLLPAGGVLRDPLTASPAVATAALAQIHEGALSGVAIERRARPALYSVVETFPEHQSAFAFMQQGNWTYLATTYQNVLRASDVDITHDFPKATHTTFGGARVDPSFPVHQVILVRHGSVTYRAQVIAAELLRDVAVVRIHGRHPVIAAECVGVDSPRLGDRTFLFSAGPGPSALEPTRRFGRITSLVAPEQIHTQTRFPRHGEGGLLVNIRGNAIGIGGRPVTAFNLTGGHVEFVNSTDLNVAFELIGQPNECEEEGELPAALDVETLPTADPIARWRVAELALPAVMSLETVQDNGLVTGTGFGVHTDGISTWLATNHHVLGDGRFLTDPALTVRDGDISHIAEIVVSSKGNDVALVRVDGVLPTLSIGCERPTSGTPVVAIGSPGDTHSLDSLLQVRADYFERFDEDIIPIFLLRMLAGIPVGFSPWHNQGVSQQTGIPEVHGDGLPRWPRYPYLEDTATWGRVLSSRFKDIKHTARIFHGNSGGPLLNLKGEVVGLNNRFDRGGGRHAVNVRRLVELFDEAGIPNPCEGVPEAPTPGGGGGPAPEPIPTPSVSLPPAPPTLQPSPTTAPEGT